MNPSKTRQILSWVVGILVFGVLNYGSEEISSYFGLSTSYYFEGFEYDEYVEEDKLTSLGWFLFVVQIAIASRIGMAIYFGNFTGGTNQNTNLLLMVIMFCLGIYASIDTLIWELFEEELRAHVPPFIYNILNFGFLVGVGYLGFRFYQNKIVER